MLQIKTITIRLDNAGDFDKRVNAALEEGWRLTRREVLQPKAQGATFVHIMLYAELEKVIITEKERDCGNCRYGDQDGGEPCDSCVITRNNPPTKWEEA